MEVTSLGYSSAADSSKPADWKPIIPAHHSCEVVFSANLWTKVTFNMKPLRRRNLYRWSSSIKSLHLKADLFQQGVTSSGMPSWGDDNINQPRDTQKIPVT
jgi:hypothetical protein